MVDVTTGCFFSGSIRTFFLRRMNGQDQSGLSTGLKRQREPLFDTEDNVSVTSAEVSDFQKRRRLEVLGEENFCPNKKSSSRNQLRSAEIEVKPDTPAIYSVRSRVQQLTQGREGGPLLAQRCFSDPGYGVGLRSVLIQDGFKERHLIGDAEFISRVERFTAPVTPQTSPLPTNRCPFTLSDTVTNLQMKLEAGDTPSSKQASRIRQEREEELRLLRRPITENAFLKRSFSDTSLTERSTSSVSSSFPRMLVRHSKRLQWPPFQSGNAEVDVTGDEPNEVEGSFSTVFASTEVQGEEHPIHNTGEESTVDMDVPLQEVEELEKVECTVALGEGKPLSENQEEEAGECGVEEEHGRAEYPARDMENHQGSVLKEDQREGVFYMGEQPECHSDYNKVAMDGEEEVGSMVEQEKREVGCAVVEGFSLGPEPLDPPNDEFGSPLYMEMGSLLGGKQKNMEVPKGQDQLDVGSQAGPEQGEPADPLAQSDRKQEDTELLSDEELTGKQQSEAKGQKKVTFILEPEMINDSAVSELDSSSSWRRESTSETELNSHDETNTAEMIDQMFSEVLDVAAQRGLEEPEEGATEDHNSGIATVTGREEKTATDIDTEKAEDVLKETHELEPSDDEDLLTFPPRCVLSPLSKSVEAVVTPMRLAVSQLTSPPLSPETSSPADSAPLYSIDAYRTLSQSTKPAFQNVTPAVQRKVAAKSLPRPAINTKERILVLNEEAAKLQAIISQTLHALSCCTDEEHGRGSLEEAEAEKLLLVSCEKREALLAEVSRLKELGSSVSGDGGDGEPDSSQSQLPCRGTISISNVQLPLKVEFVCSARTRTGRPTHYFFVLIRYGPCNIIATPLATAVDAQNGDTISFPTSICLQDIRSNFEIDVEVYSLSPTSGSTCNTDLRRSTKSKVTPRKLLGTMKRSNHSVTSSTMPALNTRRSSNFCLVGSHKITLASLGQSKFPLDKMKFEGKIRRLLGDEFQEKVPFLSPLEGNIYLQLDSESHSNVQNHGFLTMFEVVNGFGAWHRRFFVLEGNHLSYWNHPNDRESKAPEDSISLSTSSHSVKPVNRDSCARPFTFELVSSNQAAPQDQQSNQAKCWFSADTREDRADWMDKLNQVLLDLHTWSTRPPQASGNIRESTL
ncbi:hypothetical protein UPYG_G00264380 [Umbra pygmaea]|uniref:PH domain-containing protein n=1 Tax=Umbra pygmaea TaxID=75934 RepID=A0ABD0WX45_UMBPY